MPIKKVNAALSKPMKISPELAAVIGAGPMSRGEVVKAIWVYIKKNDMQDPKNKRDIIADEKLKKVFGGKAKVNMFEMTKLVSGHLS
jgi:chromatin remodeling complex protein RSC6